MIVWNGYEIAPQKIKRIQLGNKIIYIRNSKLSADILSEIDFEAIVRNALTVPLEIGTGLAIEIAAASETQLHVVASDILDSDINTKTEMETELYVELTAPMVYDEPLVFVLDTEAISPETAVCEMDKTVPVIFEADGNAATTVSTGKTETLDFETEISSEGNAAETVQMEKDFETFDVEVFATVRAADSAVAEGKHEIVVQTKGELFSTEAVRSEGKLGIGIELEAELWIKPSNWIAPVLKNNVLGITQCIRAEQSGNILKIY